MKPGLGPLARLFHQKLFAPHASIGASSFAWRICRHGALPPPSTLGLVQQKRFAGNENRTIASSMRGHNTTYCVVFPEFEEDDSRSLEYLAELSKPLPPFERLEDFTVNEILLATQRAIYDFSIWYEDHEEAFTAKDHPKTFEAVLQPIVREMSRLRYIVRLSLQLVVSSKFDNQTTFEYQLTDRHYLRTLAEVKLNLELFKIVKELHADPQSHNHWQRAVIRMFYNEARFNGVDETQLELETMITENRDYAHARGRFRANMINHNPPYEKKLESEQELENPPDYFFLSVLSSRGDHRKGPWEMELNPHNYIPLMRYVKNRSRRYLMWRAWNMRSGFDNFQFNNSLRIGEIRIAKHEMAVFVGCPNYLNMTLGRKMAGSEETIKNFLFTLKSRMKQRFARKYQELCYHAKMSDVVEDPNLKPWDMYYYSRKEALATHRISAKALQDYFPAYPVVNNLFVVLSGLLGFTIEDVSDSVEKTEPEVKVLKLTDTESGDLLGHIYLDLYQRADKMLGQYSVVARNPATIEGVEPAGVAFLNFNFEEEEGEEMDRRPTCLSWEELEDVARKIAQVVHTMLAKCPFGEVAGRNGMEHDTHTFFMNFVEQLLHQPRILSAISNHFRTGDKLKYEDAATASHCFMESNFYEVYRRIFLSEFDFWNYVALQPFWKDLYSNLYQDYFPFELEFEDDYPCSFTPIYVGKFGSSYYGELWSKMMAIDAMETFQIESNHFADRQVVAELGLRLRNEILSVGGALGFRELFRSFKGADPSVEPFLKFYGATGFARLTGQGPQDYLGGAESGEKLDSEAGPKKLHETATRAVE